MVIYLSGEVGAGKTVLARGVLRALGAVGRIKSPTFTLVEPYVLSKLYLYHFDFYRFHDPGEWLDAGLREYFNDESVCLVEWPEKIGEQLPPPDVRIGLAVAGSGREVTLSAATQRGKSCLERLA